MSLWILDTDHVSLFLAGNKSIIAQVAKRSNNIAITIITVQELFNGWTGKLNNSIEKDLRIASITLSKNALVVTRNYRDFSQIPNLKIENWAD